jgi:hypothetical protein
MLKHSRLYALTTHYETLRDTNSVRDMRSGLGNRWNKDLFHKNKFKNL